MSRTLSNRVLSGVQVGLSAVLGLCLTAPIAVAEYVPPRDRSYPQEPTASTGRRGGCAAESDLDLTAIAPHSYVGQTVSAYPTLSWYVPNTASFPMEVRLYEYDRETVEDWDTAQAQIGSVDRQLDFPRGYDKGALVYSETLQSAPGIMSWSMPQEQPGLTVGQDYVWEVILICNANSPSSDHAIEALIEVVERPAELEEMLTTATASSERADLYGQSGLWYDAWQEFVVSEQPLEVSDVQINYLENLVNSEMTSEIEDQNDGQEKLLQLLQTLQADIARLDTEF